MKKVKYTLRYLDLAREDIIEIKNYLSQFYPSTPVRFFKEFKLKIETLMENPNMYAEYPPRPEYRKLNVKDYLVFYKIRENEKVVEIYRILHGARNITDYLE